MHVSRNNFVQIERCNRVDRLYCAEVTEIFAPGGGHVYHVCDFWEDAVIRAMRNWFWKKAGSHHLILGAFGEDRQPLRRCLPCFERRQSFVAGHVVSEKAGSHNNKVAHF